MHPNLPQPKNNCLAPFNSQNRSPRVSDKEGVTFQCMYCDGKCIKAGKALNGKQRFQCKKCHKKQLHQYSYNAKDPLLNQKIIALTKEGVGIRGTARLLGISPTTLIARIKKIASEIKEPALAKGKNFEVDELRTFVKKKEN